jgi:CheY-like chemotaxis protein
MRSDGSGWSTPCSPTPASRRPIFGATLTLDVDAAVRARAARERCPLSHVADEALPLPTPPTPVASPPAPEEARGELSGLRVLLIEDDPDGREALALAKAGARVEACDSAATALRALEAEAQDVLVSDVGMPGESGYDLIRRVRERHAARIPAIAVTGFAGKEDRDAALRAGFDDHVAKPVDVGALVGKLRRLAASAPG